MMRRPGRGVTLAAVVCAGLICVSLGGCVVPQAEVGPEGTLEVFGPTALADGPILPDDWVLESEGVRASGRNIAVSGGDGSATLTLTTGPSRFVLARRVKASLLASPYIGWSWRMAPAAGREADIRLLVGFHAGNPESRSWGSEPFAHLGTNLPPFDRAIAIVWGNSALERGSLSTAAAIPEYTARGGAEHTDQWWSDNLDLADLYRKAWPNDRIERVRIMFVGFAVSENTTAVQANFGDIVLYR